MNYLTSILIAGLLAALFTRPSVAQPPENAGSTNETKPKSIDEFLLFFPSKFPTGDWAPQLAWLVPKDKLNSDIQIAKYRGPFLQSHGSHDRTIPFSSGEKLYRSANEPKRFVTIENAGHNNWLTDAYLKQLDEFITQVARDQK